MVGNVFAFHIAHVWEHLIACSQLAVVDWRQQKTEKPAEEMEREREREHEWKWLFELQLVIE